MEELQTNNEPKPAGIRPTRLTVLCILTFIGSGMNLFSSLIFAGMYDTFLPVMLELAEKFELPGREMLAMTSPAFLMVNAFLYAGSIAGAVVMFKLQKTGFHIYTISQILLLISPMYFLKLPGPGIPELIFTGLFIFLYSTHLKQMQPIHGN